jgi:hypothetical protein
MQKYHDFYKNTIHQTHKHYSSNQNIIRKLRITFFSNQSTISERNQERDKIDTRIDQTRYLGISDFLSTPSSLFIGIFGIAKLLKYPHE